MCILNQVGIVFFLNFIWHLQHPHSSDPSRQCRLPSQRKRGSTQPIPDLHKMSLVSQISVIINIGLECRNLELVTKYSYKKPGIWNVFTKFKEITKEISCKRQNDLNIIIYDQNFIRLLKGHWTTLYTDFFFQKGSDFYTIRIVYLCSDCIPNRTCNFNLTTKICEFFCSGHFKKSTF